MLLLSFLILLFESSSFVSWLFYVKGFNLVYLFKKATLISLIFSFDFISLISAVICIISFLLLLLAQCVVVSIVP